MIEFKAECGHTVRARDEDSGGVVRCSYCGRPATVPEAQGDELDFLFDDLPQPDDDADMDKRRRGAPRLGIFGRRQARNGEFNPFAIVLKLCYAALLIIIVIFVGRKFVVPLLKKDGLIPRFVTSPPQESSEPAAEPPIQEPGQAPPGLIHKVRPGVLYVRSTPPGALVYFMNASDTPSSGRIYREKGCQVCPNATCKPRGADGFYVVEVALPVRDRTLKRYPDYMDFRRAIDQAAGDERNRLAEEYFIPDGGVVFIDEMEDQKFIVRQYRDVEMRNAKSTGVRALFLPRIRQSTGAGFSIDKLLRDDFIPREVGYSFDEEDVRSELEYYGVPQSDRPAIIEVLKRIGVVPYATPDHKTRLFKIGINNGWFAQTVIHDANP